MINIGDILMANNNFYKHCKLYSTVIGACYWSHNTEDGRAIVVYKECDGENKRFYFNQNGQFIYDIKNELVDGECALFPSAENRDWSAFKIKVYEFKPFDKVVCQMTDGTWKADFFSHYTEEGGLPYNCTACFYDRCLPFNEETAKLIGTKKEYNG